MQETRQYLCRYKFLFFAEHAAYTRIERLIFEITAACQSLGKRRNYSENRLPCFPQWKLAKTRALNSLLLISLVKDGSCLLFPHVKNLGHRTNWIATTRDMALLIQHCCVQLAFQIGPSEIKERLDFDCVRNLCSSNFGYYVIQCHWYAFFVHNSPLLNKPT